MNGSRSHPPRQGERSSLDALNRTIEGLEARIEGLLTSAPKDSRAARPQVERQSSNPVSEILERQRTLDAGRERLAQRLERRPQEEHRPIKAPQREKAVETPVRMPVARPDASLADTTMKDIAQALVGLRHELKQDISEGLTREMNSLRAEIRGIKAEAPNHSVADDMRDDMQRLAESINQLGRQASPAESQALRREFDELRLMIDGLAREDSVQRMETRWGTVEDRLSSFDGPGMHDEIAAVAFRLDDIKSQLGAMSASPMVHALEDKILTMAQAVEMLGKHMEPDNHRLVSQFSALDERLDEISRAIVASGRTSATAPDNVLFKSLENRIAALADQLDVMAKPQPQESGLGLRIEALAARMEELANEEAAARLEERLEQLSTLLERSQKAQQQPELNGHLADISRKIDALDQGTVNDALAERLDYLSRRIEELDMPPQPRMADERFSRLEDRLVDIAQRLEDAQTAPLDDHEALRGLEAQIAHLSGLISAPRSEASLGVVAALPGDIEHRMNALEEYLATSDEYIIEAARQAAEAVMEAYGRNGTAPVTANSGNDMAAISALADDLRTLEQISRSSDERTARTFEALHETLVQIAGKLERLDVHGSDAPRYDTSERSVSQSRAPMPKATMPQISDDDDVFADVDLWKESELLQQEMQELKAKAPAFGQHSADLDEDHDVVEASEPLHAGVILDGMEKPPVAKGGLLSGLTKRLSGPRREPAVVVPRQHIDPTPSIDASDMIAPEEANQLLEPGSGVPDVKKILERVRAGQTGKDSHGRLPASEAEKADFIAAARRAAAMAADEADTLTRTAPRDKIAAGAPASSGVRRPIMMAVGAVLLAILSYPLVSALISGDEAPVQTPVAAIKETITNDSQTANLGAVATGQAPAIATDTDSQASATTNQSDPLQGEPVAESATTQTVPGDAPAEELEPLPSEQISDAAPLLDPATNATNSIGAKADAAGKQPETATLTKPTGDVAAPALSVPDDIGPASLVTAAKANDPLAQFEIGARYTEGRGVKTDLASAAKWYQQSADSGFAPAQYRLANLYEKGTGLERDLAKAKTYYTLAADQGNASAMHNLAVLFATGADGTPNYKAASDWFAKAADFGVRDSQFNLAILFARGNGVPQDLEESYKWFAVAARDGDKDAAQKRDEVANAMRPDQLASAKAKFDLWKPKPLDTKSNTAIVPDEWVGKGMKTASVDMTKAIRNIQAILNNNGFDAGKPDGQMGKKTVTAIKAFQASVGQKVTGEIDDALVQELLKRNKG